MPSTRLLLLCAGALGGIPAALWVLIERVAARRRRLAGGSAEGRAAQGCLPVANLGELEALARPLLSSAAYGYFSSGAESESALRENLAALQRYRLLPRVLVDVSRVDTSCELFGRRLALPVLVAPMAMQRLCHADGELAVARAAAAAGTSMVVSTMATASIEEVAGAHQEVAGPRQPGLWFQIYVLARRDVTAALVRDAEALGYQALVVTVDAPRLGKREADERNAFTLPPGLSLANLERITREAAVVGGGAAAAGGASPSAAAAASASAAAAGDGSRFGRHFSKLIDDSLTWEFIPWLKAQTSLPVLVKGVLAPDDARRAVEAGADGIVVSNHGGRQLDSAPAAVDVLPAVAAAVGGRVPLLVDGGVRRGSDVVKCLALGATAVLLGRPVLWALAVAGQAGVEGALEVVRAELELNMALLGVTRPADIGRDFIIEPPGGLLQVPAARR